MCIENKISSQGIHYLRYLMSWVKIGGTFNSLPYWTVKEECKEKYMGFHGFKRWLESLELPEEEIRDIISMAGHGKFELECSARDFLKSKG